MNCELCQKQIEGHEVFGPVGRALCFKCEQKRQNPRLLSVAAYTAWCGSCGRSIDRYPIFLGDDYHFECQNCDADNVHIKTGRVIGPRSKHWKSALELFNERQPEDIFAWASDDEVKTDPPLSFCVKNSRRNWIKLDIEIKCPAEPGE
jgi:hypothetical protein